jgi:hypothetical protein
MTEQNFKNKAQTIITIPKDELTAIIRDKTEATTMLCKIIAMWKHEEKLKQHHRPYLHIRKETEKMCDAYLNRLSEMNRHFEHGIHIRFCEDADMESKVQRDEFVETVQKLADDMLTLMEYLDVQRNMISLLESGIVMEEVTEKFNRFLNKELDVMMDRLDKVISEYSYESE